MLRNICLWIKAILNWKRRIKTKKDNFFFHLFFLLFKMYAIELLLLEFGQRKTRLKHIISLVWLHSNCNAVLGLSKGFESKTCSIRYSGPSNHPSIFYRLCEIGLKGLCLKHQFQAPSSPERWHSAFLELASAAGDWTTKAPALGCHPIHSATHPFGPSCM